MTIAIADVCTDAQLAELVPQQVIDKMQPTVAVRDAYRTKALEDVLAELEKRSPPIYQANITNVSELRSPVGYLTLYRLARDARGVMGDRWDALSKDMWREYSNAVTRSITVDGSYAGPTGYSFSLERR